MWICVENGSIGGHIANLTSKFSHSITFTISLCMEFLESNTHTYMFIYQVLSNCILVVDTSLQFVVLGLIVDRTLDCNWNAPEQHLGGELTSKTDLFTLGCIIFYCITGGIHPFGEDLDQRCKNVILNNPVNLSHLKDMPEAYHLISRLLNPEPKLR